VGQTAGLLCIYGSWLASKSFGFELIVLTIGSLATSIPPLLSNNNYFFASFSRIFFIDAPECIPRNLALSFRTSFAILFATRSSAVNSLLLEVTDLFHSDLVSASFCFSSATLLLNDAFEAFDF